MKRRLRLAPIVLGLLASFMTTCGQNQTVPGGPSNVPTPPPTTAVPAPSPAPVIGMACGAGPGSPHFSCSNTGPTFDADVESSISELMQTNPEIFDFHDLRGANPRVVSVGRYFVGLIDKLGERGLCAFYDGDALQVKKTNAFDDTFQVYASNGHVRRGPNAYSSTCRPASFPVGDSTPPPDVPGCALGGSRAVACGNDVPQYLDFIGNVITEVIQEHPELFDFHDIAHGTTDGYKVLDPPGFINATSGVLTKRGFCSIFTGDMQIKGSNTFSESYHILSGSNHIRHDIGAFNGTCYPAAF